MNLNIQNIRKSLPSVFLCGLFLITGCVGDVELHTDEYSEASEQELYVASKKVWTSLNVPVCWEDLNESDAESRQWVKDSVTQSWEKVSGLRFTGWGACQSGAKGIKIQVKEAGPHVKALGDSLAGKKHGMVLNHTFNEWSPSCQSTREHCVRTIAVHEFGHAIGFSHEQNRSDTPTWCDEEQGGDGDITIGAWDLDSVMNYCNPTWSGHGHLSVTDIDGVHEFYTRADAKVRFQTYARRKGWSHWSDEHNMSGSDEDDRTLRALRVNLGDELPSSLKLQYRASMKSGGWQSWANEGEQSGKTGWWQKMQAVELKLNGAPAGYHIEYRAHVDGKGWTKWVRDGETAGTTGEKRALEALEVRLITP